QIGGDSRSLTSDAMTAKAVALAGDDRTPALSIAGIDRPAIERIHVAQVGDDAGDFGRIELERLHAGSLDAVGNDPDQILIGHRIAKLSALEIDAADAITVRAVAGRALRVIQAGAISDVRW